MSTSREVLEEGGPLHQHLPDFRPRPQQQAMAQAVAHALKTSSTLVIEAGTGVGKTFAYLVPALLSGGKVIISTGTRHLQDQLYHKDLPVVRAALGVSVKTALLKGRANYLCLHRLQYAHEQLRAHVMLDRLQSIREWAARTRTGDIAELTDIPEDSELWPRVTSTVDNCLGAECPQYQRCHVVHARRAAQEADLVVINHHLLFADLALKKDGFAELLPSANAFILDEAHQLAEIATNFFGEHLSGRQLQELARDTVAAQLEEAADSAGLRDLAGALEQAGLDVRLAMGRELQRGAWVPMRRQPAVEDALAQLETCLNELRDALQSMSGRGKALTNACRRTGELAARLNLMRDDPQNAVQWFETFSRGFVLHHTPLQIADTFHGHIESYQCAWVFTSATLAVAGDFTHFTERLGIVDAECVCLDSPFDFTRQALLYLPRGLPDPSAFSYTRVVVDAAMPVLNASGGRAFMLFTSHRALREAAGLLAERIDFPLLVQGVAPRRELLERFRKAGNAVLLGTSSFWEGVDVRGSALSVVIIDKLPFASIGDPVLQARLASLTERGENPFMSVQVPQAVIALKQGIGRLIRDENDTGVLMICDPRLISRGYGRAFRNSLPRMPLTHELADVETFLNTCAQTNETACG
ncbi:MAG: ATP-dependent DNA helicase [Gammaproteobacteria bacterium]|nr:ATP-dependent DNA helicase [Gammaproteobacteria bacterium]